MPSQGPPRPGSPEDPSRLFAFSNANFGQPGLGGATLTDQQMIERLSGNGNRGQFGGGTALPARPEQTLSSLITPLAGQYDARRLIRDVTLAQLGQSLPTAGPRAGNIITEPRLTEEMNFIGPTLPFNWTPPSLPTPVVIEYAEFIGRLPGRRNVEGLYDEYQRRVLADGIAAGFAYFQSLNPISQ